MNGFRDWLASSSKRRSPIILAADFEPADADRCIHTLNALSGTICAIKMNLQMLLPLGLADIQRITSSAHKLDIPCLADIKLNDIGNTNAAACDTLWKAGFDAVIVNPIMGHETLRSLSERIHDQNGGIISLCHMSSPKTPYNMDVSGQPLYLTFLSWALDASVDGIIVGATYPDIIRRCHTLAARRLDILSPGVGVQGGSARHALDAGSDYIIVGRSIINAKDPVAATASILS